MSTPTSGSAPDPGATEPTANPSGETSAEPGQSGRNAGSDDAAADFDPFPFGRPEPGSPVAAAFAHLFPPDPLPGSFNSDGQPAYGQPGHVGAGHVGAGHVGPGHVETGTPVDGLGPGYGYRPLDGTYPPPSPPPIAGSPYPPPAPGTGLGWGQPPASGYQSPRQQRRAAIDITVGLPVGVRLRLSTALRHQPGHERHRQHNGKAVTGFVLGICSVVFFFTTLIDIVPIVLAFVFSLQGLAASKRGQGHRGLAIAGVALAGAATVIVAVVVVFFAIRSNHCQQHHDQGTKSYNQCLIDF